MFKFGKSRTYYRRFLSLKVQTLRTALLRYSVRYNSEDYYGRPPLQWALWNGHKDVETTFVSKGASEPVDVYGIWTMFSNLEGGMDST